MTFDDSSTEYVSILVDPRASMHAITGILPIKQVDVSAGLVERALTKMQVGFVMGPILTRIRATPTQGGTTPAHATAVTLPSPAEQNGTWSWWERSTNQHSWDGYDLINSTTNAGLEELPNTLREGILQLSIDLNANAGDGPSA